MLYKYMVKFQLLAGDRCIDEISYCSDTDPCAKNRALLRLEMLWADTKDLYVASRWASTLREAVELLKNSIRLAEHEDQTLPFSKTFEYLGKSYTIEVCILAGAGHFRSPDVAHA